MLETLQQEDSVLYSNDVGSLNESKSSDLNFLSELQLIKEVFDQVRKKSFLFTISFLCIWHFVVVFF